MEIFYTWVTTGVVLEHHEWILHGQWQDLELFGMIK
jgi:hypothetical protein